MQISTDMLLIITSTVTSFLIVLTSMTLNDLEPLKLGTTVFFAPLGCGTHFKSELRRNGWR